MTGKRSPGSPEHAPAPPIAGPADPLARDLRWATAVGLAGVVAFAPALRNGFAWDDLAFIPGNPRFANVSEPVVFFASGLWDWAKSPIASPLYRPFSVVLMWALDRVLGADPTPWHAVGVLLHALDAALVYLLARRLAPRAHPGSALAGGLLFALHPVHVEAVAWTTSAFVHPFAGAFALLAAHAQLSHARSGRAGWLAAATASCTAALLTHEGMLAVPLLLVALAWIETGRRPGPGVLVAAAVPLAISFALRARAVGSEIPVELGPGRLETALVYTLGYARDLVFPWPQGVYLDVRLAVVATAANVALGAGALLGMSWLALRLPRGDRARPGFALLWIAACLAPLAIAAMNPRPQFAPRGLYLPSVGLALLAAWAVERARARARRAVVAAGGALLVAALGGCAVGTRAWRDDLTVRERMVETDPMGSETRLKLGMLLDDRGQGDAAREQLETALALASTPGDRADALEALGSHHGMAGRLDDAEPLLRRLVAEFPARSSGWQALGNVAYLRGDLEGARSHYVAALRADPTSYEAAHNLALVSRAAGDGAAAEAYVRLAASLRAGR